MCACYLYASLDLFFYYGGSTISGGLDHFDVNLIEWQILWSFEKQRGTVVPCFDNNSSNCPACTISFLRISLRKHYIVVTFCTVNKCLQKCV